MKAAAIFLIALILLGACQPTEPDSTVPLPGQTAPPESQAKIDLTNFFVYLNHGKFEQAAALYGGSYEELVYFNPDVDTQDKAGLLKNACEVNGFPCLQLYSYDLLEKTVEGVYVFSVSFRNADGSQFVLGPCCGADETQMPPVSAFTVRVRCGETYPCQVLDLPPYVP